jgi:hypothetical protein
MLGLSGPQRPKMVTFDIIGTAARPPIVAASPFWRADLRDGLFQAAPDGHVRSGMSGAAGHGSGRIAC